jgi:TolB protein
VHVREFTKLILVCVAVFTCGLSVQAERLSLESYASNLDSIPIAIMPFTLNGERKITDNEPWKVLAGDLEFSGKFMVNRLPKPDSAYLAQHAIPLYIDGAYVVTGAAVDCECALRDSRTKEKLFSGRYNAESKQVQRIGHQIADQLIEMLFNEKGIFCSRIIAVKDDGSNKNIVLMDWDGTNQKMLTQNTTLNLFPTFVDSVTFLWTSFLRGHPDIYKGTIGGKYAPIASTRAIETSPAYSPIEGKIAFASSRDGNMEIYTCNLDGTGITRLTHAKSIETSPCFSPNGYQIAFTSDRDGAPAIYLIDADGANQHRLSTEGGYQDSPAWSPKGDKIAFHSNTTGKFEIWTINADGTNPFEVTNNVPGSNEYPSFAPDGEHIVFASTREGKTDLYAIKTDGTHLKRLTNTGNIKMPDWSK